MLFQVATLNRSDDTRLLGVSDLLPPLAYKAWGPSKMEAMMLLLRGSKTNQVPYVCGAVLKVHVLPPPPPPPPPPHTHTHQLSVSCLPTSCNLWVLACRLGQP